MYYALALLRRELGDLLHPLIPFCFAPGQKPGLIRSILRLLYDADGSDSEAGAEEEVAPAEEEAALEARAAVEHGAHALEAACLLQGDLQCLLTTDRAWICR